MIDYTGNCVGCPTGMGCLGNSCPYAVPAYICDECKQEVETLYLYCDEQICLDCLTVHCPIIKADDREY